MTVNHGLPANQVHQHEIIASLCTQLLSGIKSACVTPVTIWLNSWLPAIYEFEFVCNLGRHDKEQQLSDSLNFFPVGLQNRISMFAIHLIHNCFAGILNFFE